MKSSIWNFLDNPKSIYYVILCYISAAVVFSACYLLLLPLFEGTPSLKFSTSDQAPSYVVHFFDFFYFSLTSQATVGYGDIIPATTGGKITAIIQAVFGYFYLAFTIAFFTGRAILRSNKLKLLLLDGNGKKIN